MPVCLFVCLFVFVCFARSRSSWFVFHDRKSKAVAPVVYAEASALVERWKDVVRAARNADSY